MQSLLGLSFCLDFRVPKPGPRRGCGGVSHAGLPRVHCAERLLICPGRQDERGEGCPGCGNTQSSSCQWKRACSVLPGLGTCRELTPPDVPKCLWLTPTVTAPPVHHMSFFPFVAHTLLHGEFVVESVASAHVAFHRRTSTVWLPPVCWHFPLKPVSHSSSYQDCPGKKLMCHTHVTCMYTEHLIVF